MPIIRKTFRFAAMNVAGLVIALALPGLFSVWFVEYQATQVARSAFGFIETAVLTVDAGVTRVNDLIATCRTEVREFTETMTSVDLRAEAKRAALKALTERLETSLAPRLAQIRQAMTPLRDAVSTVDNLLTVVSSLPMMADHSPQLAELDQTISRLEELSLEVSQLRGTLQALAAAQPSDPPNETIIARIKELTERIDTRLIEVQTKVQGLRSEIDALQVRMSARKSHVELLFKLLAILATLVLAWLIYSQIVVIQYHRAKRDVHQPGIS